MVDLIEKQRLQFLPGLAPKLGFYVYALRDPRDGTVFYVGKGRGNRAYQHARAAVKSGDNRSLKLQRIKQIHAAGREVMVEIVRYGITDEKTAFLVEAVTIDALTFAGKADLSHQIAGHGDRWSSLEELRHLAAPRVEIPPEHRPSIIIRPRKKYSAGGRGYTMTTDELWEITRGGWTMRRRDFVLAFCVHDAIIRGVWRVTGWDEDESHWGKGRRALLGEPAEDLWPRYLGGYVGDLLPRRGGQLPFTILRPAG